MLMDNLFVWALMVSVSIQVDISAGLFLIRFLFRLFNELRMNAETTIFIFSEICTRDRNYWYRNTAAMSTPFYTWKDSRNYDWTEDATYFQNTWIRGTSEEFLNNTNQRSCVQNYNDNVDTSIQPSSNNAFLNGNDYHAPDHSLHSGMNVIDFPMHWNFEDAKSAFRVACNGDYAYNDPTYNVVYVDSTIMRPMALPKEQRFAKPQDVWAENLCLMYTLEEFHVYIMVAK